MATHELIPSDKILESDVTTPEKEKSHESVLALPQENLYKRSPKPILTLKHG